MEYMKTIRMEQAAFLLYEQNLRLEEIAELVGYDDYCQFAKMFTRFHGVAPRVMRKSLTAPAAQRRFVEEKQQREFSVLLREGWAPVLMQQFAEDTPPDPRLQAVLYYRDDVAEAPMPCPELVRVHGSLLRILPGDGHPWVQLRWIETISEEVKLDLVIDNTRPEGPDVALAISGDLRTGYRLRVSGYHYITLETVADGYWHQLYRCRAALSPQAQQYRFTFWRAENVLIAELDGQRLLDYVEPFALYGPRHQTFALGCMTTGKERTHIRSLCVYQRTLPQYVDILEPGRVLLRHGYGRAAANWFQRILREQHGAELLHEAAYLRALAEPGEEGKDRLLAQVGADSENPFRTRALHQLALRQCAQGHFSRAVATAQAITMLAPEDPTPLHISSVTRHPDISLAAGRAWPGVATISRPSHAGAPSRQCPTG